MTNWRIHCGDSAYNWITGVRGAPAAPQTMTRTINQPQQHLATLLLLSPVTGAWSHYSTLYTYCYLQDHPARPVLSLSHKQKCSNPILTSLPRIIDHNCFTHSIYIYNPSYRIGNRNIFKYFVVVWEMLWL